MEIWLNIKLPEKECLDYFAANANPRQENQHHIDVNR
jgi:hypothetical protein